MSDYINIYGQPIDIGAQEPSKSARKSSGLKKTADRDAATVSCGFVVRGHPPGEAAKAEIAWMALVDDHKSEPKKTKHPGPLALYLLKGRKRVAKPFELEQSAQLCAAMAGTPVAVKKFLQPTCGKNYGMATYAPSGVAALTMEKLV